MNYLEQYNLLRKQTPHVGLQCVQNENSPYCQYTEKSKNCYMTFASYQSEDCLYNTRVFYCRDCVDCSLCQKCELCYWCLDCIGCYNCNYCAYCEQGIDSDYCFFCIGIQDCFGCVGLKKGKFQIFNQRYAETDYRQKVLELKKLPKEQIYPMLSEIYYKTPRVAMYGKDNEAAYGENIHQCKDVYWGFDSKKLRDCNYVYHCDDSNDLLDCSHLGWSEQCYQIMSGGGLNNCIFCYGCWDSNELAYCELVYNSKNCFMCVGMNHAQYCILNQKYSPEDYERKILEIRASMIADGTWGKWYPSTFEEVITYGL